MVTKYTARRSSGAALSDTADRGDWRRYLPRLHRLARFRRKHAASPSPPLRRVVVRHALGGDWGMLACAALTYVRRRM